MATDLIVTLHDHIEDCGVIDAWEIKYAIEKCHDALCPLDDEQLEVVSQAFPELITLANQYASRTPGKRVFRVNETR